MLRNYCKIALRTLKKQKGYAFINISGLAAGLAGCVLILLYVQDELSFDRYHTYADRIYRVALDAAIGDTEGRAAKTSAPIGATLVREYPEVESATRLWPTRRVLISYDNNRFYEEGFLWADSTVFKVFTFPLVAGDPNTALTAPYTIVISEAMAKKYFGDEDPIGKALRIDSRVDYTVTGVMKNVPRNSHFRFDFLASLVTQERAASLVWIDNSFYTYILLKQGADPTALEAKFPTLIHTYVAPQVEQALGQSYDKALAAGFRWGYFLEPLTDIYLHSTVGSTFAVTGDIRYVYILSAIAVFILFIACINFMNLATARSAGRAREVGLRKVLGSARAQVIRQFLGESILLSLLALTVATGLILVLLPVFNDVSGKSLSLHVGDVGVLLGLVGIALGAGLLAGIYPAFVLSAFQPIQVLKGSVRGGARSTWFRSTLVVIQFAISITLLVGTGVVFNQVTYMQNKQLGFAKEQVVVVPIETQAARQRFEAFRSELLENPGIVSVAASNAIPGRVNSDAVFRVEGVSTETLNNITVACVSLEFQETLDIEVAAGRSFSRAFPTDLTDALVINEAAARQMGFTPEEMVGKKLIEVVASTNEEVRRTVIGVVEDFHFESLHQAIRPLVMSIDPASFSYISVRVHTENLAQTLAFVKEKWQVYEPAHPYRYIFLDQDFDRLLEQERRLGQIFGYFTLLAILIACLGLFGLVSFMAEQRTKEIGVRKVLGASVGSIVALLSKEFTKLVLMAALVAFPIAFFLMNRWLSDFAYRVEMSWEIFLMAGLIALLGALLTVSYQSIKAALADPVKSLRYE